MRKLTITAVSLVAFALAAVAFAVPAMAGNGAETKTMANTPNPAAGIPGMTGYDFMFPNGNGVWQNFAPTSYTGITTPSGNHNQELKGVVANDTGATVTYSANSGGPLELGQECWNFVTGESTADWSMTIEADGNYTLSCHFAKVAKK